VAALPIVKDAVGFAQFVAAARARMISAHFAVL
jgi:hypothetical protein